MAVGKEIRTKIKSIQNTKKITKAMEMVAASKMRKAQDRMAATKPYAQKIREMISHLSEANPEYQHPWLQEASELKRVGVIVVSSDRGLCGGLNTNLFRKTLVQVKAWQESGVSVEYALVGRKAKAFFARLGSIAASVDGLGDAPTMDDLLGTITVMLEKFEAGELDAIYIAQNGFVNAMSQNPNLAQLLPVANLGDTGELTTPVSKTNWDYLYEPSAEELLTQVLERFVESQIYQAVVENVACEMAARMVAMKAATDNAGKLIEELQTIYNKARQAAITTELNEIVAGAAAV